MKKLTALLLLVALLLLGCSQAKDQLGERGRFDTAQPTSLDLENLDEQLIEELSLLTGDELNEFIFKLHLLELTQSDILNKKYPFPDNIDEILQEALSCMTIDELNEYIHRLYEWQADIEYDEAYAPTN